MQQKSLSHKLLAQVLSVYFILTLIVSLGHVYAEYFITKNQINDELNTLQKTFSASLSRAIWELNTDQVIAIAQGVNTTPAVVKIIIRDEHGNILNTLTQETLSSLTLPEHLIRKNKQSVSYSSGLFGYTFPLIFEYSGRSKQVGDVTLLSDRATVIDRITASTYVLIANAIIKTTFLVILFLIAFRKHLTEPLSQLTQQIKDIDLKQLSQDKITLAAQESSELNVMATTFTRLINRIQDYQKQLSSTQQQLLSANNKLDQHNLKLEQDVARKTSGLSQAMIDLQHQKQQLEIKQQSLIEEISYRRETEQALLTKKSELETTVDDLKQTQVRLIQSEKMAALGGLVAGITHEVNTPVGIAVTTTSLLSDKVNELNEAYTAKTLTSSQLASFIDEANQCSELLQSNLTRAAELIASFKQIAVDQTSDAIRTINLAHYLTEVIRSLLPNLKQTKHHVEVNCPDNIIFDCPAGAISQIITNLMINALVHAFEDTNQGLIRISALEQDNNINLTFSDNGKGLTSEQLAKLFDPFFTTKLNQGGSGLGAHIVYNLVRQTLHGSIQARSEPGKGLHYHIRFPIEPMRLT